MTSSHQIPPLIISVLNDTLTWEKKAFNARSKIKFALRHLSELPKPYKKNVGEYTTRTYKLLTKGYRDLVNVLIDGEDDSEDVSITPKTYEYLIFLFRSSIDPNAKENNVYVLSTHKAYKKIRIHCSDVFPRKFSSQITQSFLRVQKISTGQFFGHISDSSMRLLQPLPEGIEQSSLICREVTAIYRPFPPLESGVVKVKFKENGVLIYRELTLEQYIQVFENSTHQPPGLIPPPIWAIPGLPNSNLIEIQDLKKINELDFLISSYIGWQETNCSFSLRLSERWCSNAYQFRLIFEDRPYGITRGEGGSEFYPVDIPGVGTHPQIEQIRALKKISPDRCWKKQVYIEYRTTDNQTYTIPLIDIIEGWIRESNGNTYFKMGPSWYKIHQKYTEHVEQTLSLMLTNSSSGASSSSEKPNCILNFGEIGYLSLPWPITQPEVDYNRSYMTLNPPKPTPPIWFDGNQKFRTRVELFDILQLSTSDDAFVYHVKKSFNNEIRIAVSQLIISAQIIHNTRYVGASHRDYLITKSYCDKLAGKEGGEQILKAFVERKLHFVLAFQVNSDNPLNEILQSNSLIAKRDLIRAKEEIEKLGFIFRISPIAIQKEILRLTTPIGATFILSKVGQNRYFINNLYPASLYAPNSFSWYALGIHYVLNLFSRQVWWFNGQGWVMHA